MSVKLNGLMVPVSGISDALARYVDNLIFVNDDEVYKVSLHGSATPLKYRGRFYLLCCRHQLGDRDCEEAAMLLRDGSLAITSAGVRHFKTPTDSDYSDLVVFDFTEPCLDHVPLQSRFFNFTAIPPDAPEENTPFLQVCGFPSATQKYELEELNHLGLVKAKVICELDGQPNDDALLRLKTFDSLQYDPDGMSGGSAFTVQFVDGIAHAFFGGMTVRAGRDHIHILKSGYIRKFLDTLIAHRAFLSTTEEPGAAD